ncbi:trehalose-6-phosphate synthase [Frankia sp. AiPa1]|uniref:alpha,alpha-trehalose-phosphate synthase (UDP-forming) n=1 Tax=Frankia sp. AiPa1 TaxID=573492 RepID=UPI00202B9617|nr:trehalose-6-phosphate synthase [Frankia sp. AiPa1]MCL9759429.1 trehalose-6-phosphate synthase [Frankia sp. AiPa1]
MQRSPEATQSTPARTDPAGTARVLVASNRGPVAFASGPDGELQLRRGAGGLVSGLAQAAADAPPGAEPIVWVCAALGEADRRAAGRAPDGRLDRAGFDTGRAAVRILDVDPPIFDRAYNAIANRVLWFIQHMLYAPAAQPVFGAEFRQDWAGYEAYNAMFAEALAQEAAPGASVLVQDYHLMLVPGQLRRMRPDLRIAHFSHTPWAPPEYFRILPDDVREQILRGLLGADRLGFLTDDWADAFEQCVRALPGIEVRRRQVRVDGGRTVRVGVHPLGVDAGELRERAGQADVASRAAELAALARGRRLIVRVDRTELSKNIVRGLLAYRELLRTRPQWRGKVMHLVCAYPSRHNLPEYREYTASVRRLAAEIDDEFAVGDWCPLRLEVTDDYPRSIAALSLAEVLVVNPVRDGMNLVAKEGAVLSRQDAVLVLSREAGAHAEMGRSALVVNPFDVQATAAAMHTALVMPASERHRRAAELAGVAGRLPPRTWFTDQLAALASGS